MEKFVINIPYNLKTIIWKKNEETNININITNLTKKFKIYSNDENIAIDKWSNSLIIKNTNINILKVKISTFINNFLKCWDCYFFNKIKFKGKGFRIRHFKKIKLIKFFFGRSHKTFMLLKKLKKKKINKYKFALIGINKERILKTSKKITLIKKINFYTLRGLRASKQIIFKRKGKKGTYI